MKKRTTLLTQLRHKRILVLLVITIAVILSAFFYTQNIGIKSEAPSDTTGMAVAYFAGGCFWSTESAFEKEDGVTEAISGYMGGDEINPSYEEVASERTGHRETVKVFYDPAKISYEALTEYFLKHIDPTDSGGSFYDRGHQYTSAIYYQSPDERAAAFRVITKLNETKKLKKPIVTQVEPAKAFYAAEDHHQNYSKTNPIQYSLYRKASGRDEFFAQTWGE